MMELPQYYFPVRVSPHLGEKDDERMSYAEYGPCTNVNEMDHTDDRGSKCIPQKAPGSVKGLDDILPMLPLTELDLSPLLKSKYKEDPVLGIDYPRLFSALDKFFINMKMLKTTQLHHQVNKWKFDTCKTILRILQREGSFIDESGDASEYVKLSREELMQSLQENVLSGIATMCRHYSWLQTARNKDCFRGFNREFYKGLLCSVNPEDSASPILFHAKGTCFRDIYMSKISQDKDTALLNIEKTEHHRLKKPVYQISSSRKGVVCVRHAKKCTVLLHDTSEHSLRTGNSVNIDEGCLTDVCPSQFLANEVLLSEKSGHVVLWDINTNHCQSLVKKPEFQVENKWVSSYFAGHPRQIVIADCTSVQMFDHRSSLKTGSDLFTLSSHLVKNESVMSCIPMDFPHHIIGTDYTIFMMDQRFPCSPVLQWHPEEMISPQMISYTKLPSELHSLSSDSVIVLGTQQPAEILCLQASFKAGLPPMSKILPWQLGKPRVIFEREAESQGVDWSELEEKFQATMAGMTVIDNYASKNQGFSVFQMDVDGDLFYQQFPVIDRLDHNSDCYQLKKPSPVALEASCERVRNCLSRIDSQRRKEDAELCKKSHSKHPLRFENCKDIFKAVGQTDYDEEDPSRKKGGNSLPPDWQTLELSQPHTQVLIALKNGNDLTELLKKREEDQEKKKAKMRAEALKMMRKAKSKTDIVSKKRKRK